MIRKLASIANKLDELGLYDYSNKTTKILVKLAENPVDFEYSNDEFDMVKNQLAKAMNAINGILEIIEGKEGRLEDWVQSKITLGVDYLDTIADYMIGEKTKVASKNEGKKLNKPFRTPGGPKKFSVYVKNDKGNVVKVNFGDPNLEIKRDDPQRRKNYRARHNCDNPGPKWKANYWSCKNWEAGKSVTDVLKGK
jgi:hypothetical protein